MAKIFSLDCKSVKLKVSEHYVYINEDMLSELMMKKIKESSSSIETGKEYFADVQIQVKVYPSSITASEVEYDCGKELYPEPPLVSGIRHDYHNTTLPGVTYCNSNNSKLEENAK